MNLFKSIIPCLALLATAITAVGPPSAGAVVYQVDPKTGYYVPDYYNTANWAYSPELTKFADPLPGLYISGLSAPPTGQYIPVAVPDTATFPGSDYYEIELGEYSQQMHSGLANPTKLRGYRQTNTTDPYVSAFHYLGPVIIATKGKPVRIKFTNNLPTGTGGDLFIPVDTSIMGSGEFTINYDPQTKAPMGQVTGTFTQNRATLHLHGGLNPWISDGTAHQWTAPVGETTVYPKGVSVQYVPDMWFDAAGNLVANSTTCTQGTTACTTPGATNNPGAGKLTFYWTNDQSARLMFYHDHAYGITRLNVYAGEAAGYLINDPLLEDKLAAAGVPGTLGTSAATTDLAHLVPLVIQDKTFVDAATISTTDPTWAWGSQPGKPVSTPVTGDLWWPHVYMPAQNPYNPDLTGINAMGRWHYGPWFFPGTPVCGSTPDAVKPFCIMNGPVANEYYDPTCDPYGGNTNPGAPIVNFCQPPERPGMNNPSWGAEAFLDTMVVNGAAYPTMTVNPEKYRFRVLNAAHDRFLNLQLYRAVSKTNYLASFADPVATPYDFAGTGPADLTEVAMVPAAANAAYPATWPTDGREGGVPDPATRGPAFLQIATEGGILPAPVVLPNQPVQWNLDPTMFNVGNVLQQRDGGGTLLLGPAERADVIVDFSQYAGQTLILYNDAPTAFPALDPHYDYYTGAPDRTDIGGYGPVLPGVGPNIRTVMQIVVAGTPGATAPPVDAYDTTLFANLQNAFKSTTAAQEGLFAQNQHPLIVGQSAYGSQGNSAYFTAGTDCDPGAATQTCFPPIAPFWGLSNINSSSLKYDTVNKDAAGAITFQRIGTDAANPPKVFQMKAIHDEMGATFDDYGRMSAKLGLEMPFTNAAIANFILQNFVDPVTEIVTPDEVQLWRISHNGVDTHPIHFHLFDVQLVNRVGWDGFMRLPDDNELGFKDTLRISPLEDTIVALRPSKIPVPWQMPNSVRPLNPTQPLGSDMDFSQVDPTNGGNLVPAMVNQIVNLGEEYTWHCHILSHEENDMMRVTSMASAPAAPSNLVVTGLAAPLRASLSWTDNSTNESGWVVQRATNPAGPWTNVVAPNSTTAAATGSTVSVIDPAVVANTTYYYRVIARNSVGGPIPYPVVTNDSAPTNVVTMGPPAAAPTIQSASQPGTATNAPVNLVWTDNSPNVANPPNFNAETSFTVQRSANGGTTWVNRGTIAAHAGTGIMPAFTDPSSGNGGVQRRTTYIYRILANNIFGSSTSNSVSITTR